MSWCEYPGWLAGSEVLQNYGCRMASGFWITIELVLISVLIGFAMALALAIARLYGPRWASLAVGGYTTFSSFSLQTLDLLRAGGFGRAALNIGLSVVLCVGAVALGHALAARINGGATQVAQIAIEEEA